MGYYTSYELSQVKNYIPNEVFSDYINTHKDEMYALDENGECAETCKWYEHDDSVKAMSKEFPNTVFKLHGEGEETADIWDKYYHNGRIIHSIKEQIVLTVPDLSVIPETKYVPKVKPEVKEEPVKGRKFKKGI